MASTVTANRNGHRQMTFEDLRGRRAEGYIRDSTLDQRDGFGPEIQRRNIQRFAESYGLVLGERWYTEFVSGRIALKRHALHQFIQDAETDGYDVLLVDNTSRFGRNQGECIRFKEELHRLGKAVVFVSQGIISGRDRDFLAERINETLDEQYSRNLSRYVAAGMAEKASQGLANGVAPLGYKSEKLDNGKRERKVLDPKTMPALVELLRCYASGRYSYLTLADHLNSLGYRNREGQPFTRGSIEQVLENRFYTGKVVYHPGQPDEEVRDGSHEVPAEVKELWFKCQEVKMERARERLASAPRQHRIYPFSGVTRCSSCQRPYHGKPAWKRNGRVVLELEHHARRCGVEPTHVVAHAIQNDFDLRVLPHLRLDEGWKGAILACLDTGQRTSDEAEVQRLEAALKKLRDLYLWSDIDAPEYQAKKAALERQRQAAAGRLTPRNTPNLDRAAGLLHDLPALWHHPAVTDLQRQELLGEVFEGIFIEGKTITGIQPRPEYIPLFAYQAVNQAGVSPDGSTLPAPTFPYPLNDCIGEERLVARLRLYGH